MVNNPSTLSTSHQKMKLSSTKGAHLIVTPSRSRIRNNPRRTSSNKRCVCASSTRRDRVRELPPRFRPAHLSSTRRLKTITMDQVSRLQQLHQLTIANLFRRSLIIPHHHSRQHYRVTKHHRSSTDRNTSSRNPPRFQ